jgi:hypothetical protein
MAFPIWQLVTDMAGNGIDPQITSSVISTLGGAIFGGGGMSIWERWRRGRRSVQDQRCERICNNMVTAMETMLAVIEAVGAEHPNLNPTIVNARVQIAEARRYLDNLVE